MSVPDLPLFFGWTLAFVNSWAICFASSHRFLRWNYLGLGAGVAVAGALGERAAGLVVKNPIVGAGIGQDILVMNDERGIDTWRRVHNAYLQYGVDLGLPGLLLFAWLHLTCYRTARTVERRAAADPSLHELRLLAAGVTVSLVAFGVAAMFHPIAYQFYFFTIAGLAVALKNTARAIA